ADPPTEVRERAAHEAGYVARQVATPDQHVVGAGRHRHRAGRTAGDARLVVPGYRGLQPRRGHPVDVVGAVVAGRIEREQAELGRVDGTGDARAGQLEAEERSPVVGVVLRLHV